MCVCLVFNEEFTYLLTYLVRKKSDVNLSDRLVKRSQPMYQTSKFLVSHILKRKGVSPFKEVSKAIWLKATSPPS